MKIMTPTDPVLSPAVEEAGRVVGEFCLGISDLEDKLKTNIGRLDMEFTLAKNGKSFRVCIEHKPPPANLN